MKLSLLSLTLGVTLSNALLANVASAQTTPAESLAPAAPSEASATPPGAESSPAEGAPATVAPPSDDAAETESPAERQPTEETSSTESAAPPAASETSPEVRSAAPEGPPRSTTVDDGRELTLQDRFGKRALYEEHPSELTIAYSTAIGLDATRDFASNFSFAGFELDWHRQMTEHISLGLTFTWQVLYEKTHGTLVSEDLTITGTQLRHLNVFPILASARFFPLGHEGVIFPYLGAGIGIAPSQWRAEVGFLTLSSFSVHLALAPELGVQIPTGAGRLALGVRYNFAFASAGNPELNYFAFTLGLAR